jgi:hypothetical protein
MLRLSFCLLALGVSVGAGPADAEEPKAIVEHAVKALGGKELLARQTAWKVKFQTTGPANTGVPLTADRLIQPPDRFKEVALYKLPKIGEMEIVHVVVGRTGWVSYPRLGEVMALEEETRAAEAAELHVERVLRLLPLLEDQGVTLSPLSEEVITGRAAVGLRAAYKGQPQVSVWFDKETGLPLKTSYRRPPATNRPAALFERLLSDYRDPSDGAAEEKALAAAGLKPDADAIRAFLKKQVPDPDSVKKARELVEKLADDDFDVRERAAAAVVALGAAAVGPLEAAVLAGDVEKARRAKACLGQIEPRTGTPTTLAAVRWLGLKAPPGAAGALLELVDDGAEAGLTEEVKAALLALALRPGGPPEALTAALTGPSAARRAVAAAALGRDGGAYLKQAGRRLHLPGLKQPMTIAIFHDGDHLVTFEVLDFQYYSRFDDKELARPSE